MLTEELEKRKVLDRREEKRFKARDTLNVATRNLILAMVTVEYMELYSREEIEGYVLKKMGEYETLMYGFDDDEFEAFLQDEWERLCK